MTEPNIPRYSDFQAETLGGLDFPVVIFPVIRKRTFMTEIKRSKYILTSKEHVHRNPSYQF